MIVHAQQFHVRNVFDHLEIEYAKLCSKLLSMDKEISAEVHETFSIQCIGCVFKVHCEVFDFPYAILAPNCLFDICVTLL